MNQYDLMRVQQEIDMLTIKRRELRKKLKSIEAREHYISEPKQFAYSGAKQFRADLAANLNESMMPVKIGGIDEVMWPYYFQAQIDFGTDPLCARNIIAETFFQVDEEACFLMMGISREHNTDADGLSATWKAPLVVEIEDRQSTRKFNAGPIPLQSFGENSLISVWPTPMLILNSAVMDVKVYGIPPSSDHQQLSGNGEIQFSFFGYRTRIQIAQKILSMFYGC